MKALFLALFAAFAFACNAQPQNAAAPVPADPASLSATSATPVIVAAFTDPQLSPSHWTLTLHPDGSGHFTSEMGTANTDGPGEIRVPDISRDVKVSSAFAASVFQIAQHHAFFNQNCESHMKVAFQGWKMLSYDGPNGKGSCTYNYSRDHEIQTLGENLSAVAETILEGERLKLLLQHDPLGLDKEIESLVDAAQSGRAQQLCAIRGILERLAQDDQVLDMVRRQAKVLLARADT